MSGSYGNRVMIGPFGECQNDECNGAILARSSAISCIGLAWQGGEVAAPVKLHIVQSMDLPELELWT
jgi:hypothetical protein